MGAIGLDCNSYVYCLQAFGVGIEEDEEDGDIYSTDKMSNYDLSIGDEPVELHSFTKPSGKQLTIYIIILIHWSQFYGHVVQYFKTIFRQLLLLHLIDSIRFTTPFLTHS